MIIMPIAYWGRLIWSTVNIGWCSTRWGGYSEVLPHTYGGNLIDSPHDNMNYCECTDNQVDVVYNYRYGMLQRLATLSDVTISWYSLRTMFVLADACLLSLLLWQLPAAGIWVARCQSRASEHGDCSKQSNSYSLGGLIVGACSFQVHPISPVLV